MSLLLADKQAAEARTAQQACVTARSQMFGKQLVVAQSMGKLASIEAGLGTVGESRGRRRGQDLVIWCTHPPTHPPLTYTHKHAHTHTTHTTHMYTHTQRQHTHKRMPAHTHTNARLMLFVSPTACAWPCRLRRCSLPSSLHATP